MVSQENAKRARDDGRVTESSEESFPASDPPSFNPGVAAPAESTKAERRQAVMGGWRLKREPPPKAGLILVGALIAAIAVVAAIGLS